MTPEDREAALELLRDECLASRIASDMAACGVVGESTNPDGGLPGGGIAQTGRAAGGADPVIERGG